MGWPSDVPFIYLPNRETSGLTVANKGNIGPATYALSDATLRTASYKLVGVASHGIYAAESPENTDVLAMLDFFRNCPSNNKAIGGKILMVSFRYTNPTGNVLASKVFHAGNATSDTAATRAFWQIILVSGTSWGLRRQDGAGAVEDSGALCACPADSAVIDTQWTFFMDAKNRDLAIYKNGDDQTLTNETAALDTFYQFTNDQFNTNGITFSSLNGVLTSSAGTRTWSATGTLIVPTSVDGYLVADLSAFGTGLTAPKKAKIAAALTRSPRGALSRDVITAVTP